MFELKSYQKSALAAVEDFLIECDKGRDPAEVFAEVGEANGWGKVKYRDYFPGRPCVCLRVPTGGGKTVIAASAIKVIDNSYTKFGAPVVLWLTPSDAITVQTRAALSNPEHPYRQALDENFRSVKVVDVASVATLQPSDFLDSCIIIVSTIQTFNVGDTKLRTAYGFNENLEPFFTDLTAEEAKNLERVSDGDLSDDVQTPLTAKNIGDVKYSLANLLHLYSPIVIVDEAHNNRTEKFFATLGRLNPSVVLELTATPMKGANNVIYQVSAWELKAENMVKLPVVLSEFTMGWESCVDESVKLQTYLEAEADYEEVPIRPIVLIQAQPKGQNPSPEEVKQYLLDVANIPETQIAIATGSQKDLDGVDLFRFDCEIRYVITIKALKEGWDCSYAYVLCSLQNISSAKEVEQLLGRVLRMPFARKRSRDALNKAYANVVSEHTMVAATMLRDRLVETMGFNELEAQAFVEEVEKEVPEQVSMDPGPSTPADAQAEPSHTILLRSNQKAEDVRRAFRESGMEGSVEERSGLGKPIYVVRVPKRVPVGNVAKFAEEISQGGPKDLRDSNETALAGLFAEVARDAARQNQATPFPAMPRLCYRENGETKLLTDQTVLADGWNPNAYSYEVDFQPTSKAERFVIDMDDHKQLVADHVKQLFLPLKFTRSERTLNGLIGWLAPEVARDELPPILLKNFVRKVVAHLMGERGFTLDDLYLHKVELARAIRERLELNYGEALANGIQARLALAVPPDESEEENDGWTYFYRFDPNYYTPRRVYDPRSTGVEFKKHMCPMIHDLNPRTSSGAEAEEFLCAVAIEQNRHVKRWIRNIEKSEYAFSLPIGAHRFYPDFIVELTNGKILVVEYKGENLYTNEDSQLKREVGQAWERANQGRCFFLMARKKDDAGRPVATQLYRKIEEIMAS